MATESPKTLPWALSLPWGTRLVTESAMSLRWALSSVLALQWALVSIPGCWWASPLESPLARGTVPMLRLVPEAEQELRPGPVLLLEWGPAR